MLSRIVEHFFVFTNKAEYSYEYSFFYSMLRLLALFGICILSLNSQAFTIKGVVTDVKGEPLSYANMYIKGTSNGTSANAKGEYVLNVEAGVYEVVFQHIGYRQKIELITVTGNTILNVQLDFVEYQKSEVPISSNFNPADEVIRKAIARRKYFLEAVESYSCDAYVKGMNRLLDAPFWAKNRIKSAGVTIGKNGVVYLSESVSKLYYKKPNKFHEEVISSKVSGQPRNFTFNSAQSFFFNFYESAITIPVIASRPLVSPLSNNAFFYYKFSMLGAYKEGDLLINKIKVTPKRKSDPCFTGVLSIVEENWNIHSLELYITKDNGVQYVDTLKVTQYFIPVKDDLWLPSQQRYDAQASYLGIKGDGYFFGSFKNYQLNNLFGVQLKTDSTKLKAMANAKKVSPAKIEQQLKKEQKKIESKLFTDEVIKIEEKANKYDKTYWDSIRPVPLTELELNDYAFKDSIQIVKDSPAYKDSVDKLRNKPTVLGILTGYTFRKQSKRISFRCPSLLGIVNYNTVEGLNFQLRFELTKSWADGRRVSFEPAFRYGVTSESFQAKAAIEFRNSQKHEEFIRVSGGKFISQFNENQPQPFFGNTWETLVLRFNFMKLYEQYFAAVSYSRELYNGIYGTIGLNYAQRFPLENTSLFSFFKMKRQFTPNGMDLPGLNYSNDNINRHNAFRLDLRFRFVFGQKYITRPDVRFRVSSGQYPELTLVYKKSFRIKNFSDLDYDYLEAQLAGNIRMRLFGTTFYRFGGGGFPNAKRVEFSDYKHFFGNFLTQGETDQLGFFTIRYYRHSTNSYFAEAHIEHHFDGFLFNKIPGFRKLKLEEVAGFHFLYTPSRKQYFQMDLGIENIFKILRADFVMGFGSMPKEYYFGGRIALTISLDR